MGGGDGEAVEGGEQVILFALEDLQDEIDLYVFDNIRPDTSTTLLIQDNSKSIYQRIPWVHPSTCDPII